MVTNSNHFEEEAMKKLALLFAAFAITMSLAACNGEEENTLPELPDTIDMDNIDEFMNRPDVQYVDVRNFDERMRSGYIMGFEVIPVIQYLEFSDILVRTDGNWEFTADDLKNQSALESFFDSDKAIVIMCAGGTRAGYVKDALESIGFENVYNIGGFGDYDGDFVVLGDDTFTVETLVDGVYNEGVYFGLDEDSGYMATVIINANGGIQEVILDALYEKNADTVDAYWTTKQALGEEYNMDRSGGENFWFTHADILAAAIVANQGWDSAWTITDGDFDDFAGVTVSVDGLKIAFEEAIAQAE
jgi:rhodanese-related sulfurtransferase